MVENFQFKYLKPLHFKPCRQSDVAGILLEVKEIIAGAAKAGEMQEAIQKLVRCPWSNQILDISEQIFIRLLSWQQDFLGSHANVAFPLNRELRETTDAFIGAWQKLGAAYSHWIQADPQQRRKFQAFLMLRLFESFHQILALYYFFHWQLPDNLWRDIHSVYRLAMNKEVVARVTKLPGLHHGKRTSLEKRYKQNLLLGLAQPYGLMPQEIKLLEPLMEKWAPLLVLESAVGSGWRIHFDADLPAVWADDNNSLRINFSSLMKLLKEQREFAAKLGRYEYWEQGTTPDTLSMDLLDQLVQSWLGVSLETANLPERCHLLAGFKPVFDYLAQGEKPAMWMALGQDEWLECHVALDAVQVGDLVGIVEGDSLEDLAVVARLTQADADLDSVRLKLRPLLHGAEPVGVQPLVMIQKLQVYQRGVLGRVDGKDILLLQQQPLEPGVVVRVLKDEGVYPIKLEEKKNPARGVLQFSCLNVANHNGAS